jgi:hypothetical protein
MTKYFLVCRTGAGTWFSHSLWNDVDGKHPRNSRDCQCFFGPVETRLPSVGRVVAFSDIWILRLVPVGHFSEMPFFVHIACLPIADIT